MQSAISATPGYNGYDYVPVVLKIMVWVRFVIFVRQGVLDGNCAAAIEESAKKLRFHLMKNEELKWSTSALVSMRL